AVAEALIEKRVWMEPGANTTYLRWRVLRAREPVALTVKALVDYRDYHATTRGGDWRMDVARVPDGLRVTAFDGARPLLLRARPEAKTAPAWIRHLVLAADQFVVRRPLPDDPDGATVIAGYHWFGDWGRDTMIALPGLTLAAGRPEVARKILTTFARFVDRGMLPN